MSDVETVKQEMFDLLWKLKELDADLQSIASGRKARLPKFSRDATEEDIRKGLDKLSDGIPEESRLSVLKMMLVSLHEALAHAEAEGKRIKNRMKKDDGEDQEKPEFRSFCKRKGEW